MHKAFHNVKDHVLGHDHPSSGGGQQPLPPGQAVVPKLKRPPQIVGLLSDPGLNRDSLAAASARFGDRVLWTCRDTQLVKDGRVQPFPIICNTASWTDLQQDGKPALKPVSDPLKHVGLPAYGHNTTDQAFFPILKNLGQPPHGGCNDGSRYAIWPDSPPLVTHSGPDGRTVAWSWIKKAHIKGDLSQVETDPPTTLHRIDYNPSEHRGDKLPKVSVVDEDFWKRNEIPFGDYGGVVHDGTAYLYGQNSKGTVALARVPADSIDKKSKYEYYVDGSWTSHQPTGHHEGKANIPNVSAGGQGTFYYSPIWKSFVWIGGTKQPGADFYITTAPRPEGPWIKPFKFYSAPTGNFFLGGYSLQANPALIKDLRTENAIYLSYTKNDVYDEKEGSVYTTPLVYVEWE